MDAPRTAVATKSTWWRWPLVPVGAIVVGVLAGLAMSLFQWLSVMMNWGSSEGWYASYISPLIVAAATGYAFGWAACTIAPSGKRIAGTVMTTLLAVVNLLAVIILWNRSELSLAKSIFDTLGAAAAVATATIAVASCE